MPLHDLGALLPMLVLAFTAVVVMLAVAFHRNHALAAVLSLVGLAAAFIATVTAAGVTPRQVTPLVIIDAQALFYTGLFCAASFTVVLLSYDYFRLRVGQPEEFYILLLLATLGCAVLAASNHFASFFLGLELLSVTLYAMIAYRRAEPLAIEAGVKYLVLAATSAAFLLLGMALIYAQRGTMEFSRLAVSAASASQVPFMAGVALLLVGLGFKLALVPFHLWTPDVYQGAPAPVTAWIATVSKGAVFTLLLRLFSNLDVNSASPLWTLLALVALSSMLVGNWLALLQQNVKRILAYSSIAHLGYLLVAFLAGGRWAASAVAYYLVAYFVTTLGAFGVLILLSPLDRDADRLDDYHGLAWRRPWLAAALTAMLLSLAGIPLTAGFLGKFYVLAAGAHAHLWSLLVIMVVSSAIGLFYYLRVVVAMYLPPRPVAAAAAQPEPQLAEPRLAGGLAVWALGIVLVWLGVYPLPLIHWIEGMAAGLSLWTHG